MKSIFNNPLSKPNDTTKTNDSNKSIFSVQNIIPTPSPNIIFNNNPPIMGSGFVGATSPSPNKIGFDINNADIVTLFRL